MFRKLVIVLMLLAAPFAQAKMVLACAMMEGGSPQTSCCCEHARSDTGACDEPAPTDHCCTVGIEKHKETVGGVAESGVKIVKKLWDNSPDITTAPPPSFAQLSATAFVIPIFESRLVNDSDLYLLTARLRL
ncbi:MAG: hypothetical protein ACR2KU_01810 [Gammaproteobacteria bacterium]|nr:hypothetical protein [Gammaproteobacteria bacterium]